MLYNDAATVLCVWISETTSSNDKVRQDDALILGEMHGKVHPLLCRLPCISAPFGLIFQNKSRQVFVFNYFMSNVLPVKEGVKGRVKCNYSISYLVSNIILTNDCYVI